MKNIKLKNAHTITSEDQSIETMLQASLFLGDDQWTKNKTIV